MNPAEVLQTLASRGVSLWLEGERVKWKAPAGALSDAEIATLKAHKAAILKALQEQAAANDPAARQRQCDNNASPPAANDGPTALVTCGACAHFQPDTVGDGTGLGRCQSGAFEAARATWWSRIERLEVLRKTGVHVTFPDPPEPLYPGIERRCSEYQAREVSR